MTERGFTLLEVLLALAVAMLVLGQILPLVQTNTRALARTEGEWRRLTDLRSHYVATMALPDLDEPDLIGGAADRRFRVILESAGATGNGPLQPVVLSIVPTGEVAQAPLLQSLVLRWNAR